MRINQETKGDIAVVRPQGNLDIESAPDFKKKLAGTLNASGAKVLIDLAAVDYVDSSGLATFVEMLKIVRTAGGVLKLSSVSSKVRGLFEITKLDSLFDIAENEDQALEAFGRGA